MAIGEYFLRYLRQRDALLPADIERLAHLDCEVQLYEPGEVIVPAGTEITRSCMTRGMLMRVHALAGRKSDRAISTLHVPGDFVDLHGFVLSKLDHSVVAVGQASVRLIKTASTCRFCSANLPRFSVIVRSISTAPSGS